MFRNTDNFGVSCSRRLGRQQDLFSVHADYHGTNISVKMALWSNVKEWFHQVFMKIDQDIVDQPGLEYNCKLCLLYFWSNLLQLTCFSVHNHCSTFKAWKIYYKMNWSALYCNLQLTRLGSLLFILIALVHGCDQARCALILEILAAQK